MHAAPSNANGNDAPTRRGPCTGPARAAPARSAAPMRARAFHRLGRVALLCGLAPRAAAGADREGTSAGHNNINSCEGDWHGRGTGRTGEAPGPSGTSARAPATERRPQRHALAARALSEMLCDAAHAGRCRATVRHSLQTAMSRDFLALI